MNNQLSVFEGKPIVILLPEDVNFQFKGDFLIRVKDVAEVLGYGQSKDLAALVKEKYVVLMKNSAFAKSESMKLVHLNTMGETFLTNHGLNQALANSTMPKAEPFQDWLYEKVLPSIQKTGSYSVKVQLPQDYPSALRALADQVEITQKFETQVIEMQPKVDYLEKIVANPGTMTTTQISKDYGMTAQEFNKLLHSYHIQYKRGDNWYLYEEYDDYGYTQSHTHLVETEKETFNTVSMKWTQVGRKFLYQFLKEKNIFPLCDISTIHQETLLQKC